jgi:hypothetical protein
MFLKKLASHEARVVDLRDCPPDGELHAVNEYPKYYDAIYYPALYDECFMTAESCVCWLEHDLNAHLCVCDRCHSIELGTRIDVKWVSPIFYISSDSFFFFS